eukprot:RCo046447
MCVCVCDLESWHGKVSYLPCRFSSSTSTQSATFSFRMKQPLLTGFASRLGSGKGCALAAVRPAALNALAKPRKLSAPRGGRQMYLDAGQKVQGLVRCPRCGMQYTP